METLAKQNVDILFKKHFALTYNGEEWRDKLVITTEVHVPVWQRIKNLFVPVIVFEHQVYLKEVAIGHVAVPKIFNRVTWWERLLGQFRKPHGLVSPAM